MLAFVLKLLGDLYGAIVTTLLFVVVIALASQFKVRPRCIVVVGQWWNPTVNYSQLAVIVYIHLNVINKSDVCVDCVECVMTL